MKTMRLEFGPHAGIRFTEMNDHGAIEKTKVGVYVLSKDFLAICLHDARPASASDRTADGERTSFKIDYTANPQIKSHCMMVLKRIDQ
jgi:hypothetical protein